MRCVFFNPKSGEVKEERNEGLEKEYEEKGFVLVRKLEKYQKFVHGIFYCQYHNRFEIMFMVDNNRATEFIPDFEFVLKVADIVKDCRFVRPIDSEDVSCYFAFPIQILASFWIEGLDNLGAVYLPVIKKLNEVSKGLTFLFIHDFGFRKEMEWYLERYWLKFDDIIITRFKNMFAKYVEGDTNIIFSHPMPSFFMKFMYKLYEVSKDDKLVGGEAKLIPERLKNILMKIMEWRNISESEKRACVEIVYRLTNDRKLLKYLL